MADKRRPTWQEMDEAEHLITEQRLFHSGVLLRPSADSTAPRCGTCRHPSTDLKPYKRGHIDSAALCPGCIARADALFDAWERGEPASRPRDDGDADVFARAKRGQGA